MPSRWILALPWIVAPFGCATTHRAADAEMAVEATPLQSRDGADGRLLIRAAALSVEVDDTEKSADAATRIVSDAGGMVDRSDTSKDGAVELAVRVPEAQLEAVIRRFEALGDVTRRTLTATDVTEEVVDLDARMKNLVTTRASLRGLLDKATSVQDVVAVEKELSRVQGDIDSMEAKLKSLRSRIALSEIRLTLRHSQILGPLGYIGKGVWWVVEKLFVIRS